MRRTIAVLTALVLGTAAPAHAAEGGLLTVNGGLIFWTVIIFLVVLGILSKFAYPKILGAVEARERHLEELSTGAERDRAEAAALLEDARRQREEVRAQAQAAVVEGRTAGERARDEIVAEAQRQRAQLLENAQREIDAQRDAALADVRREAVDVAIRAAEKLVRRTLDGDDNRRLVAQFLAEAQLEAPARTRA